MTDRRTLGAFDAPVLLFGGPYGNAHALDALFTEAKSLGIPPDRMLCTGDLAAYAADPQAVVDRVREARLPVVMGNVEEALGFAAEDCRCGFVKGSECDLLAARWYRYADASVDADAKAWMRRLPRRIDFEMADRRFAVIHGGVGQINQFIFPATPRDAKESDLDAAGADAVVCGHSGLPFTEQIGDRMWHNPGAVGLPANDGTPRVWYSLLTPTLDGCIVELRPLRYDHRSAAARIRDADLPSAYADALETGLWPTDDVMPDRDRERRGIAIALHKVRWVTPGAGMAAAD